MVKQKPFAGMHTAHKLDLVENYLSAYLTALKNSPFKRIFFDAFAGTGEIGAATSDHESLPNFPELSALEGSARRALSLPDAFDEYVFADKSAGKLQELSASIQRDFPERHAGELCRWRCE